MARQTPNSNRVHRGRSKAAAAIEGYSALGVNENMKAIWKNTVLAESDDTVVVENNQYFPADSLNKEYFVPSNTTTHCPWKGEASYYSIVVDGDENKDAAWYYPEPKEAAKEIKNRVAFWKGVEIDRH